MVHEGAQGSEDAEVAVAPAPASATRDRTRGGLLAPVVVLVALVLAKAAYYAHLGAGLVLDDWRLADNTLVYGIGNTLHGGHDSVSRPVAWLWFNGLYAVSGASALRLLVVVTLLNVAVALLLLAVFDRLLPRMMAVAVAVVWVLLPTHTALTVWGAITQALLAQVLLLAGVLCVQRARWLPAALLFVGAVFSYQTAIPLAFLAAAFVPATPTVARADRAKILGAVAAATAWSALHPTYDPVYEVPDVPWLWGAHFGTGVFVSDAVPSILRTGLAVSVLVGVAVAAAAWWRGRRRWADGPSLVLTGLVVWAAPLTVLVALPLWIASPEYGVADRVLGLSSVGSAMIIVGLGTMLWRRRAVVAVGAAVLLAAAALSGQYVALHSWSDAGHDAEDLLAALGRAAPEPHLTNYAVGPGYPRRNNVASLDQDAVYFAHKLRYGGGPGTVTFFEERAAPLDPAKVTLWWPDVSDDLPDLFYDPLVQIDRASRTPDGVRLVGWAVDRTSPDPVGVDVRLDDEEEPALSLDRADVDRGDVEGLFGLGPAHGFDIVVRAPRTTRRVCAQGVGRRSRPGARAESQACFVLDAQAERDDPGAPTGEGGSSSTSAVGADGPLGHLDRAEPAEGGLSVAGWALDPRATDPAAPVTVAVTVDGAPYGSVLVAGGPRPDLASWGLGEAHGLDALVAGAPLGAGSRRVCLTGPVAPGAAAPELHCLDVVVP